VSAAPRAALTGSVVFVLMLAGCTVGLVLVTTGQWYGGLLCIGAALAAGGVVRLLLPDRMAGWLRVRRQSVDAMTLTAMAVVVIAMAVGIAARA
jgi:hypothetical protein